MNKLAPIEYQSQRVLTTQQLAKAYETEANNITKNFHSNKDRFTENKDFYKLEGTELAEFKRLLTNSNEPSIKFAPQLILWTDRGANRHSKILDTDQAWKQFDLLEETYFQVKNGQAPRLSQLEILAQSAQILLEQEKAIKQISATQTKQAEEIQSMRDVVALSSTSWRGDSSMLISKMTRKLGGNEHIQDLRNESYKLLNDRMGVDLKCRLTNKRRRMADEGICKSKRDNLNYLDVIGEDKKLIEGYVAIVKEMAIKYGI
ncbi:MAG: putative phage protein [Bacillales bacterium]|jgi:hypothetical protein|nr:putative phage protein [Bacillales bacterium]